jgi:AP-3 complex subunit mu
MMDNGIPFTTEPNALVEIIPPPNVLKKFVGGITGQSAMSGALPEGSLTNTPWRKSGVKYATNEIYFDIIEELDCTIDA